MKAAILFIFLSLSAIVATAQPILTFERIFTNFDTVVQGSEGTFQLKFTNTGDKPLIITDCQTTSGADKCTWSKKPVAPGKTGYITYTFETKSCGRWNKPITVTSNGGSAITLYVKAFVQCLPSVAEPAKNESVKPSATAN